MTLLKKLVIASLVGLFVIIISTVLFVDLRTTRDAIRVAHMATLRNILDVGYHETVRYPVINTTQAQYGIIGGQQYSKLCINDQSIVTLSTADRQCEGRTIYGILPRDPQFSGKDPGAPCTTDPSRPCEYAYISASDGSDYQIIFRLEGAVGALSCSRYPCLKALTSEGIR